MQSSDVYTPFTEQRWSEAQRPDNSQGSDAGRGNQAPHGSDIGRGPPSGWSNAGAIQPGAQLLLGPRSFGYHCSGILDKLVTRNYHTAP
eukprot:2736016-Prymnesium_polylepis.1